MKSLQARMGAIVLVLHSIAGCGGSDAVAPQPEEEISPVFNQIVFESNRDDPSGDLYLMDLDGSNVRRFASSAFADGCPSFSPDGKRIAFYSGRLGNRLGLYVMHADGTSIRYVDGPIRNLGCPAWSADGSHLGYLVDELRLDASYLDLKVAAANGAGATTVASGAEFRGPALSPPGDRVLYMRCDVQGDTAQSGIFVATVRNGRATRIYRMTENCSAYPNLDWSRDGTQILFSCNASSITYGICFANPDGSAKVVLPFPYQGSNYGEARFSPDGSMVTSSDLGVSVFPKSGTPRTVLHDGFTPMWLSDGSGVGFASAPKYPDPEPYNPSDIFVGNRDGTGVKNLTKHPATDIHPSWSPIR